MNAGTGDVVYEQRLTAGRQFYASVVLANETKEGLVESPYEWPGLHAARALVEELPLAR